jgi:hypothetical protein
MIQKKITQIKKLIFCNIRSRKLEKDSKKLVYFIHAQIRLCQSLIGSTEYHNGEFKENNPMIFLMPESNKEDATQKPEIYKQTET